MANRSVRLARLGRLTQAPAERPQQGAALVGLVAGSHHGEAPPGAGIFWLAVIIKPVEPRSTVPLSLPDLQSINS